MELSTSVSIRKATVDDIAILALHRWSMEAERREVVLPFEEYLVAYTAEVRPELEAGRFHAWIAFSDGQAAASCALIVLVLPPNFTSLSRRRGIVSAVYTVPAFRRQGIARLLMQTLLQFADDAAMQRLVLWASESGRPLYEQLGFAPSRALERNLPE